MKMIPVRKEDLPILQEISRQTFYDTFAEVNTAEDMQHYLEVNLSELQLLTELENPLTSFYFACQEEEILGYLKLNEGEAQTESRKEASLEIERIYVRSSHQRKGIGQFLLDQAIQIAKAKGLKLIWLGVWEHNLSAIRFYERNEFELFGKHVFMLGTDEQTDLLLERKLD